jgi:FdhD protein
MPYQLNISETGLNPTHSVTALDEYGQARVVQVAGEVPLTLWVDDREVVTLMTLGTYPEALALGYLRNQFWVNTLAEIKSVQVNWPEETVKINTYHGLEEGDKKRSERRAITGCGQGTIIKNINKLYDKISSLKRDGFGPVTIPQSVIYAVLRKLNQHNDIYRQVGGVHGCALCQNTEILAFVEDVGRHNATDTIAGLMWLRNWTGADKIFYTTGRLTAEVVMKVAHLNIPILLSRSSVTAMAVKVAQQLGVTIFASAKGEHFLVFNGDNRVIFDVCPTLLL